MELNFVCRDEAVFGLRNPSIVNATSSAVTSVPSEKVAFGLISKVKTSPSFVQFEAMPGPGVGA